jgi:hypothetical protein
VAYISTEVRLLRGGGRGQPVTVAQSLHGDHASLRYRTAPRAQHASIYRRRSPCSVCMCPHVSRQGPRARPRRTRYEFGMRGTYGAEHGPAAVDDLRLLEARQGGGILAQTQGVETVVAALHPLPGPSVPRLESEYHAYLPCTRPKLRPPRLEPKATRNPVLASAPASLAILGAAITSPRARTEPRLCVQHRCTPVLPALSRSRVGVIRSPLRQRGARGVPPRGSLATVV